MAQETLFDEAWATWRQSLTDALASAELPDRMRRALAEAAAADPADGLIDRNWALDLLVEGEPVAWLRAHGLSAAEIEEVVAVVRRHPTPAAGG